MKFNRWLIGVAVLVLATVKVSAAQNIADSWNGNREMIAQSTPPAQNAAMPTLPTLPTSPTQVIPPDAPVFNTNGLDFTNVDWKVGTGLGTVIDGEASYWQVDADLWALPSVDIGFSANATLGAYNSGIYSAGLDVALYKNLSNFQLVVKVGVGGNFQDSPGVYGEAGVDINYNLTQGTGWGFLGSSGGNFTYAFAGVKVVDHNFQFAASGSTFEKVVTFGVGYAFGKGK